MSGAGTESLADCQKSFRRTFCSELIAVVSLLYYFLCDYPHPRPEVERNDRELRLFMVAPKTKYGSPAKGTEVTHIHKKSALKRGPDGGY